MTLSRQVASQLFDASLTAIKQAQEMDGILTLMLVIFRGTNLALELVPDLI